MLESKINTDVIYCTTCGSLEVISGPEYVPLCSYCGPTETKIAPPEIYETLLRKNKKQWQLIRSL